MKKLLTIVVAAAAACAFAQGKPTPPHADNGARQHRGVGVHNVGPWVMRVLTNKATYERMGVEDEAQRDKIIAVIAPLKAQGAVIEKKIRELSREQSDMTRGLFDDKRRDPQAVMYKISEVSKLRAEQNNLYVKALVVLRDSLAPRQLERAKAVVFSSRGSSHERMRRGNADSAAGMRGGDGSRGRARRGRDEDDDEDMRDDDEDEMDEDDDDDEGAMRGGVSFRRRVSRRGKDSQEDKKRGDGVREGKARTASSAHKGKKGAPPKAEK